MAFVLIMRFFFLSGEGYLEVRKRCQPGELALSVPIRDYHAMHAALLMLSSNLLLAISYCIS